jgi:hypothetical protein
MKAVVRSGSGDATPGDGDQVTSPFLLLRCHNVTVNGMRVLNFWEFP